MKNESTKAFIDKKLAEKKKKNPKAYKKIGKKRHFKLDDDK